MRLSLMARDRLTAEQIALRLGRSASAVRTEARRQRLSLFSPNDQLSLTTKPAYGGRSSARRGARRSAVGASAASTVSGRPARAPAHRSAPAGRRGGTSSGRPGSGSGRNDSVQNETLF